MEVGCIQAIYVRLPYTDVTHSGKPTCPMPLYDNHIRWSTIFTRGEPPCIIYNSVESKIIKL